MSFDDLLKNYIEKRKPLMEHKKDYTKEYNFLLQRKSNEFSSYEDVDLETVINKINYKESYFKQNMDKFKKLRVDYIYKCPACKGIHDDADWSICDFCSTDFS